jgi:AcrR family transcriptional regulator
MSIQSRRELERQEVRQKVLDAARALFVDKGYDAVTMRAIAENIDYSPTAIYVHFGDKEALLRELCASDFRALAKSLQRIAQIRDPLERIRKAGLAYVHFGTEHPNHYRLMFMTPRPTVPRAATKIQEGNPEEDSYAFLKSAVAEAIGAGLLLSQFEDPELVSQMIWTCLHGVVSLRIAKPDDEWVRWRPLDRLARGSLDALLRGILRGAG